jgi:hypothetical protein
MQEWRVSKVISFEPHAQFVRGLLLPLAGKRIRDWQIY